MVVLAVVEEEGVHTSASTPSSSGGSRYWARTQRDMGPTTSPPRRKPTPGNPLILVLVSVLVLMLELALALVLVLSSRSSTRRETKYPSQGSPACEVI